MRQGVVHETDTQVSLSDERVFAEYAHKHAEEEGLVRDTKGSISGLVCCFRDEHHPQSRDLRSVKDAAVRGWPGGSVVNTCVISAMGPPVYESRVWAGVSLFLSLWI